MARSTAVNGFSVPQLTDSANIETAVGPFADAVDTLVIPRFTTTSARNTAIPIPVFGQMAAVSGTGEFYMYDGTAWVSARPRVARVTSTQTVTDSVTPTDCVGLSVSVEANSTYFIHGALRYTANVSTNDMRANWTGPAGATVAWYLQHPGINISTGFDSVRFDDISIGGTTVIGVLGGSIFHVGWAGEIVTVGTSGTVQFQFAESAAIGGVTSVSINIGAHFFCWKVA